jgi:hypothetical protein
MAVDEFYFHRRRGLPRWERLGHPLDTLTALACFVWLLSAAPSASSLSVYTGLSVFSCLFVRCSGPNRCAKLSAATTPAKPPPNTSAFAILNS